MSQHDERALHGKKRFFEFRDYISEFVYGGIDGSVTTFAVVAGSAGAELGTSVVLILGFANLIADGFSMSVGNYLSTKSTIENYDKHKAIEYWEVDHLPEKEREEIQEIYEKSRLVGFLSFAEMFWREKWGVCFSDEKFHRCGFDSFPKSISIVIRDYPADPE